MKRIFGAFTAVLLGFGLAACGGNEPALESGAYTSGFANEGTALAGSALQVDVEAGTARLELADGSQIALTLTQRDRADWRLGCPGNFGAEKLQTFDVTPDPLNLGDVSLTSPEITSGCFEGDGEATLRGRTGDVEHRFVFEKR